MRFYLILAVVFGLCGCAALDERQRASNDLFHVCASDIPNSMIC